MPALRKQSDDEGEGERDQDAAAKTLDRAQDDHLLQVPREGTSRRKDEEQDCVDQQISPDRERLGKPARQRDDDDLGNKIGGRNPTAVIDTGTDRALDVGQRGVDNLNVQDRHEGPNRGADNGHPGSNGRGWLRHNREPRVDLSWHKAWHDADPSASISLPGEVC